MKEVTLIKNIKTEEFTDKILRRIKEDPERAKITGLSLVGLFSPLLCICLTSLYFIFNPKAGGTDKEVNGVIGLWTLSFVVTWSLSLVFITALNSNPMMVTCPA